MELGFMKSDFKLSTLVLLRELKLPNNIKTLTIYYFCTQYEYAKNKKFLYYRPH